MQIKTPPRKGKVSYNEIISTQRKMHWNFKIQRGNDFKTRIRCLAKFSIKSETKFLNKTENLPFINTIRCTQRKKLGGRSRVGPKKRMNASP